MARKVNAYQYYSLVYPRLFKRIASLVKEPVLELGGGKGQLTRYLPKSTTVAQKQARFHQYLKPHCSEIVGDICKLSTEYAGAFKTIVGNLPYKLTKPVIKLMSATKVPTVSIIIQYEVAAKIAGLKMSRLRLCILQDYQIAHFQKVHANRFRPKPPVDGGWLHLTRREPLFRNYKDLQRVFNYPRKKLSAVYRLLGWPCEVGKDLRASELNRDLLLALDAWLSVNRVYKNT